MTIDGYLAPIRDMRFALELVEAPDVIGEWVEPLEAFGQLCSDVIAPLDPVGDAVGASFDPSTGIVTTAPGWKEAYRDYVDGGWNSVSFSPAIGGAGMPGLLTTVLQEQLNAACMAFALCPMLTQGAVHLLRHHGDDDQRARLLPKLASGEWTGTMNLTEPQAGSDVGALTTRAELVDGHWRVSGSKVFITYGEHDLTDQIVHLVIARIPGSPSGTRGISCFVVPKRLPDGAPNRVRCIGIEHKMGIAGSPTCTLEYDRAFAEIIGPPDTGMAAMFTMMNDARLAVGVEGVGVATRAYQAAVAYARERVQGRPVDSSDVTIIGHPDVRRMLVDMRARIDAMRLLTYRTSKALDDGDESTGGFLTPVAKSWCSDVGAFVAREATQVAGGIGYIRGAGFEQRERDVRISAIYEGTNGIQALDLVRRKVVGDEGRAAAQVIAEAADAARRLGGDHGATLLAAAATLDHATGWIRATWPGGERDVLAGASPYLDLVAHVVAGGLVARQVCRARESASDDPFAAMKRRTGEHFIGQRVRAAVAAASAITVGAAAYDDVASDEL